MVKTLTEAHNGRVWIDSEMGEGSTFNILLPLDNQLSSSLEIEES
jgi:signal transduction histidine kinase